MRRDLEPALAAKIEGWVRKSVEHAREHPEASRDFVRAHAQELDEGVTRQHIDLYVNEFSEGYGPEGEKAIRPMLLLAEKTHTAPKSKRGIFVGET